MNASHRKHDVIGHVDLAFAVTIAAAIGCGSPSAPSNTASTTPPVSALPMSGAMATAGGTAVASGVSGIASKEPAASGHASSTPVGGSAAQPGAHTGLSANHIAVIDTNTNQILRTIPADSPNGMSFSKDFQSLLVSNALSGTVQEISLTKNAIVKTQRVGGLPGNIAVLPDGAHAYMVRPDGTTVEVLDTNSLMIVDTITVGTGPSVVTVCRGPIDR